MTQVRLLSTVTVERCPINRQPSMGKVEAFEIDGISCWYYSNDHRPPHFNAKRRGLWCYKVFFLHPRSRMLERDSGPRRRIRAQDRRALCDKAEAHREELLREWERKVTCDD